MLKSFVILFILFVESIYSEERFMNNFSSLISERDSCKTQIDSLSKRVIYMTGETEPVNEGGSIALMRQYNKIRIDSLSLDDDTRFIVAFIVEEDGEITFGRVIRDNIGGVGRQLLSLVKSLKWKPGTCNGKKVAMIHKIELQICLREE